jgi:hypothetical protein
MPTTKAIATSSRRCCPSRQRPGTIIAAVPEPDEIKCLGDGPGPRIVSGESLDQLTHGQLAGHLAGLQYNADLRAPCSGRPSWIHAKDSDPAAAPGSVPLENLDRSRLSCPVGPDYRAYLAALDIEVDAGSARSARALRLFRRRSVTPRLDS